MWMGIYLMWVDDEWPPPPTVHGVVFDIFVEPVGSRRSPTASAAQARAARGSISAEVVHQPAPVFAGEAADIDIAAHNGVVYFRNACQRHGEGAVPEHEPALQPQPSHQSRLRTAARFDMAGALEVAEHRREHADLLAGKRQDVENMRGPPRGRIVDKAADHRAGTVFDRADRECAELGVLRCQADQQSAVYGSSSVSQ